MRPVRGGSELLDYWHIEPGRQRQPALHGFQTGGGTSGRTEWWRLRACLSVIDPILLDLATLLECLQCGGRHHDAAPDRLTCRVCGHVAPVRDGVLHLRSGDEDPAIERERRAVLELEAAAPPAKPTDFSMPRLLDAPGPLRTAFLSLPYDDGSAFFRESEYFRNVSQFAATFDAVLAWLALPPGSRLLDVGADLTWSTARLVGRGCRAVAIDINHHLAAARLFREQGLAFAAVNVDMHAPAFADGAFDGVTAFNALHHTHRLDALVANLSRVLRPGGRLGFIEPYWIDEQNRATFGVSQIEAGINENIYRLEEWHQTFVNHGLELVVAAAGPSFHGVYEKRVGPLRDAHGGRGARRPVRPVLPGLDHGPAAGGRRRAPRRVARDPGDRAQPVARRVGIPSARSRCF